MRKKLTRISLMCLHSFLFLAFGFVVFCFKFKWGRVRLVRKLVVFHGGH